MARLFIFFPGTQQWRENFFKALGISIGRPHNFFDKDARDFYFAFNGVGSCADKEHPVATSLKFDPKDKRLVVGLDKYRYPGEQDVDWFLGRGMREIAQRAVDIVRYLESRETLTAIKVIGFSRGGAIATIFANLLNREVSLRALSLYFMLIDPVPGPCNYDKYLVRNTPPNVKSIVFVIAAKEAIVGFRPTLPANLRLRGSTRYVTVLVPTLHWDALLWSRVLVREFCQCEAFYNVSAVEEHERSARLQQQPDEVCKTRMDSLRFADIRLFSPYLTREQYIDVCFEYMLLCPKIPKVQNKVFLHYLVGRFCSSMFQRSITRDMKKYRTVFFIHLFHQLLFSICYPYFYNMLLGEYVPRMLLKHDWDRMKMFSSTSKWFMNCALQMQPITLDTVELSLSGRLDEEIPVPASNIANLSDLRHIFCGSKLHSNTSDEPVAKNAKQQPIISRL